MYGKARQLPKFNFKRGELLTVINGSYGEREKWMENISLQHSTAMSCAKGKTRIPKSSGKDRTLKEEEGGTLRIIKIVKKESLQKLKALIYLHVGCRQPTSSRG